MMQCEVVNTNRGVAVLHRHAGADQRNAVMWIRNPSTGVWNQRHLKAYGNHCYICRKLYPNDAMLEDMYTKALEDGLGKLVFVELD